LTGWPLQSWQQKLRGFRPIPRCHGCHDQKHLDSCCQQKCPRARVCIYAGIVARRGCSVESRPHPKAGRSTSTRSRTQRDSSVARGAGRQRAGSGERPRGGAAGSGAHEWVANSTRKLGLNLLPAKLGLASQLIKGAYFSSSDRTGRHPAFEGRCRVPDEWHDDSSPMDDSRSAQVVVPRVRGESPLSCRTPPIPSHTGAGLCNRRRLRQCRRQPAEIRSAWRSLPCWSAAPYRPYLKPRREAGSLSCRAKRSIPRLACVNGMAMRGCQTPHVARTIRGEIEYRQAGHALLVSGCLAVRGFCMVVLYLAPASCRRPIGMREMR
jgi:hypothetical protein